MENYLLADSRQREDFKVNIPSLANEVRNHQNRHPGEEVCGLVYEFGGALTYIPVTNSHPEPANNFMIHPKEYEVLVEKYNLPIAISHTHPKQSTPVASEKDMASCSVVQIPFVIWADGRSTVIYPKSYDSKKYEGRSFVHGVVDCYTIIRDWYQHELGIELPNFVRPDGWWDKGFDLYTDNFKNCGFGRVDPSKARKHDIVIMTIRSRVPNHGAIYLGDMKILHHLPTRLSKIDVYGGYWQRNTSLILRHKCLDK